MGSGGTNALWPPGNRRKERSDERVVSPGSVWDLDQRAGTPGFILRSDERRPGLDPGPTPYKLSCLQIFCRQLNRLFG